MAVEENSTTCCCLLCHTSVRPNILTVLCADTSLDEHRSTKEQQAKLVRLYAKHKAMSPIAVVEGKKRDEGKNHISTSAKGCFTTE